MNLFFSFSLGSNSMYLHCTLQDRTLKILNKNVNVYYKKYIYIINENNESVWNYCNSHYIHGLQMLFSSEIETSMFIQDK